jgi:Spy/CpxP family protein refolding chaperone
MKNNNLLKFALAASLILNLSLLATAGYRYTMQSRYWVSPFGKVMEKGRFLFEELSLRPEQLTAMKEKAVPFRAEIDRRRQEIMKKRKALVGLLRAANPDKKSVDAAIKEISRIQEEMQRMIAAHMLEEKALLDKGQQGKFLDLIENAMTQGGHAGPPLFEQNQ